MSRHSTVHITPTKINSSEAEMMLNLRTQAIDCGSVHVIQNSSSSNETVKLPDSSFSDELSGSLHNRDINAQSCIKKRKEISNQGFTSSGNVSSDFTRGATEYDGSSRKKFRRTLSRCGRSYKRLSAVALDSVDKENVQELRQTKDHITTYEPPATLLPRQTNECNPSPLSQTCHGSLVFQLRCVSRSSSEETSPVGQCTQIKSDTPDVTSVYPFLDDLPIFPRLPATVSSTSCSSDNLTRGAKDTSQPYTNSEYKEGNKSMYGWFVDMEGYGVDTVDNSTADRYETNPVNELAFKAPTAPKKSDYDAELEWACAADTVDDVLGDFF